MSFSSRRYRASRTQYRKLHADIAILTVRTHDVLLLSDIFILNTYITEYHTFPHWQRVHLCSPSYNTLLWVKFITIHPIRHATTSFHPYKKDPTPNTGLDPEIINSSTINILMRHHHAEIHRCTILHRRVLPYSALAQITYICNIVSLSLKICCRII